MPDLPVAVPDPAATIRAMLEAGALDSGRFRPNWDAAMDALAALLVERQQAQARIEQLEVEATLDVRILLRERQEAVRGRQQAEERIERLTEALRFYAANSTYAESTDPHPTRFASGVVPIEEDVGRRARAVLAGEEDARP